MKKIIAYVCVFIIAPVVTALDIYVIHKSGIVNRSYGAMISLAVLPLALFSMLSTPEMIQVRIIFKTIVYRMHRALQILIRGE